MQRTLLTVLSLLTLCAGLLPAAAAEKPNIVFVLFDDMGYGQPGCS